MSKKEKTIKLDDASMKTIVAAVMDEVRKKETADFKFRQKRLRANTKRLLNNYRALKDHCEMAIYNADTLEEDGGYTFAEIIDMINGSGGSSFRIESIRQSTVRTRIIIDHIDTMIGLYKSYCDASLKEEDARRYRVIFHLFISETARTHAEIAEDEYVTTSTIYRDVDAAAEHLTALIFGIDGLNRTAK
ncbi:MAG: hypothetical protein FWB91_00225 [Defluviitaleaceae bacterium]|nr:hypothetical protein [Defluviitaleaceae bacterium]